MYYKSRFCTVTPNTKKLEITEIDLIRIVTSGNNCEWVEKARIPWSFIVRKSYNFVSDLTQNLLSF